MKESVNHDILGSFVYSNEAAAITPTLRARRHGVRHLLPNPAETILDGHGRHP